MLCSNCNQEIKPVVAVDIDGVMGDYHHHFLEFAEKYLGLPAYFDDFDAHLFSFSTWWAMRHQREVADYRRAKLAYRQGGMKRTMPIFMGSYGLTHGIKDAGAELWVTTARPYLSLDNIVPDTIEWMRRNSIPFDGILFDDDKYEQLAQRVDPERVVAVFDDTPELYDAADALFPGRVWMVKGFGNQGTTRKQTVTNLGMAADIATNAIHTWKSEHDS